MKLIVTNNNIDCTIDEVVLSINEFIDIGNHPYIASSKFDVIVIDLEDSIVPGIIAPMIGTSILIPRIVKDINSNTVRLLSEFYPDRASELRFNFIKNKSNLNKLIEELSIKYEWEKYY